MMSKQRKPDAPAATAYPLRARAERPACADLPPGELDHLRLLHELRVCQGELELQNAALRESRAEVEAAHRRYEELYSLAPIGYLTLTPDGTIQQANPAAARLLAGASGVALLQGRRFGAFVADPQVAKFNTFLERVFAERGQRSVELALRASEAADVIVLVTALADPGSEPICRIALTDVSTLKQAERQLAQQAAELRAADRRKDEFLAMLGHELRNPLAPIVSAIEALDARGADDPARVRWAAGIIRKQSAQLTKLIDDLLDVARVSQGKITLSTALLELRPLLSEVIAAHRAAAAARGLSLSLALPPAAVWVEADPVRLVQVFDNLLDNAIKYTSDGGRIEVALTTDRHGAVVTVRDSGIGIAAGMLPQVFELFAQAETARTSRGGLGVGLALVKRLIELHEGRIEAFSGGLGQGSAFAVRLPPATPPVVAAATGAAPAAAPTPRRILIVDDERDITDTLAYLLRAQGHSVRTAHDGEQALAIAETTALDVVLLDIGMPRLDGLELARRLRRRRDQAHLTLIAMSGYGTASDTAASLAAGCDRHLVKPVRLAELTDLLERDSVPLMRQA